VRKRGRERGERERQTRRERGERGRDREGKSVPRERGKQ